MRSAGQAGRATRQPCYDSGTMSPRGTILLSGGAALVALGLLFLAACTRGNAAACTRGNAAACTRGNAIAFGVAAGLWVFGLLPSAAALAFVWWKRPERKRTIARFAISCLFIVGTAPAVVAGSWVLGKRVELSKLRAERVALRIELFFDEHGRYPEDLTELRIAGYRARVPAFGGAGFYRRHEDGETPGYVLNLRDPGFSLFGGGWTWYPERGEWVHWD